MAEPANDLYDPEETVESGAHGTSASRPNLRVLEGGQKDDSTALDSAEKSSPETGGEGKANSPAELADKESGAQTTSKDTPNSEADDEDVLGKGFTGGGKKHKPGLISKIPGSSKVKRWVLIACAASAAAVIGTVLSFLALLPLKIINIVTNLESHFSSTTENALGKETDNLYNGYMKQVLKAYHSPSCHGSTVDATCVVTTSSGADPVSRLYQSWKQQRLEQQLAKKYGIVIGKNTTSGKLYMTIGGALPEDATDMDKDLTAVMNGEKSIFDLGDKGVASMSTTEVRQKIDSALKDASLWDKAYFRFKYSKLLSSKYGVKLCVVSCNYFDKFVYPAQTKLKTAEAEIVLRVLSPVSQNYASAIACILDDSCKPAEDNKVDPSQLDTANPDTEQLSTFEEGVQSELASSTADLLGKDAADLTRISDLAKEIQKNGLTATIVSDVAEKVATTVFGASAEEAASAGESAVPVVGWVLMGAKVDAELSQVGPKLRILSYAVNAAAAVSLWETYNTVVSEMKSGHTDSQELGSFTQSLDTNVNPSSPDQVDATQTPLYSSLNGGNTTNSSSAYKCNDGRNVQSGQLVCPEEQLDNGNVAASAVSAWANIPVVTGIASFVNSINSLVGGLFGGLFSVATSAFGGACRVILGCSSALSAVGNGIGQITSWLATKLISSPFSGPNSQSGVDISGGRNYDMMAAGADVSYNTSCRVQLGCQQLSNQQVADIRNQQLNNEQAAFESQSFFARIFSTSSPYSLVSRIAVALPTTNPLTSFEQGMADIFSNPLGKIASIFSNIFASDKAFAATPAQPDPFGIVQYGYPDTDPIFSNSTFANDPQAYWDANCQGNTTNLNWINDAPIDQATGEPEPTTTDPCLLIESSVQSAGVMFDSSLAPAGSLNPDPTQQGTGQ